jgi:glutathione S-transferase
MVGELELEYEHFDYAPRSPETKTPQFLAMNPNGAVPVIDDDGFILAESMAINIYLAQKHKSPLHPSDPRQQAKALQWSLWETDKLDRQIVNYANHSFALPEAERKAAIAEATWKEIEAALGVLNTVLAKTPWLTGSAFTIADLNVASALYRGLSMDLSAWPQAADWLQRCWSRPAGMAARKMRE